MGEGLRNTASLAACTTYNASLQTYYTVRLLADRDRLDDAFRTYAYFRWVDDCIDGNASAPSERAQFVRRQTQVIDGSYSGQPPGDVSLEEAMLVDLVRSDPSPRSGLAAYVRNMLAVMSFDSGRRGRLISQSELNSYTHSLAVAVTEAIHYFIGHGQAAPRDSSRYLAVSAAHITHMLRDTWPDLEAGYFNIPVEYLESQHISAHDVHSPAYCAWVKGRVGLARAYFKAGREFIARVENARCRLAYFAYIARFETVLDMIERDGWLLRREYGERKSFTNAFRMAWSILISAIPTRLAAERESLLGPPSQG